MKLVHALNRNTFKMRLLLGSNILNRNNHQNEDDLSDDISLIDRLDTTEFDTDADSDIDSLISVLKKDNFQVRRSTGKFNHSKCYIVGKKTLFIGSSNFTKKGLDENTELNAGIYQESIINVCKAWFEQRWEKSVDIKKDIIDTLERSKFGVPAEPFEIFIKIIFEMYRDRLETECF